MAAKALPSQEVLRQLLDYDPESGVLAWRPRDLATFKDVRSGRNWNTKYAGKSALTAKNGFGYRHGQLMGANVRAHRVIWKLVTGEDPDIIDHINGDASDNRWVNLRSVSRALNQRNSRRHKHNTSGHTGVWYCNKRLKWFAQFKVDGRSTVLGRFGTLEEALLARKAANVANDFHENHGRPG